MPFSGVRHCLFPWMMPVFLLLAHCVYAEQSSPVFTTQPETEAAPRYVADIRVHTAAELFNVLARVEQAYRVSVGLEQTVPPVMFLLHGAEARSLLRSNYQENKSLVDLAARLSAFELVDIKVCETWMGNQRLDKSNLQPFVGTVPYAPAEENRLVEELGYHYF